MSGLGTRELLPRAAVPHADRLGAAADTGGADRLRDLYALAKVAVPGPKRRRGRNWFSPAQCAAIAVLMWWRGLSGGEVVALLRGNPDLARAVHLRQVRSPAWFARAAAFGRECVEQISMPHPER